jgi:hypothetical protein
VNSCSTVTTSGVLGPSFANVSRIAATIFCTSGPTDPGDDRARLRALAPHLRELLEELVAAPRDRALRRDDVLDPLQEAEHPGLRVLDERGEVAVPSPSVRSEDRPG